VTMTAAALRERCLLWGAIIDTSPVRKMRGLIAGVTHASTSWHQGDPHRREIIAQSDGRLRQARSRKGIGTNLSKIAGAGRPMPFAQVSPTGNISKQENRIFIQISVAFSAACDFAKLFWLNLPKVAKNPALQFRASAQRFEVPADNDA